MTKKIAVIGDWHLAFVTASVLADVGHNVTFVKPLNLNATEWKKFPDIPVMEPGLQEMIEKNTSAGRLDYRNGVTDDIVADYIWLAVDTPVNETDEPQLEPLLVIADLISSLKKKPNALIVSSQIPMGFCAELEKRTGLPVAYIPENLRLGKGIETFYQADRTVIGCNNMSVAEDIKSLMSSFKTEFLLCNAITSEMVKHANNAFLAMSISFSNELARLGEKFNVDSVLVGKALKMDKRIGKAAYVIPGLGFAGGTLPRDLRVLQKLGKEQNIPMDIIESVLRVNENTTKAISEIILTHISKNNLPKSVLILGYTYKPDTDTLRRSLSLDLADELVNHGMNVCGYDPVMNGKDLSALNGKIKHFDSSLEAISTLPSVILLMTSRPAFQELDWKQITAKTKTPEKILILDTQNFLNPTAALKAGCTFKSLWSPAKTSSGVAHA